MTVDEMLDAAEGFVCEEGLEEAREALQGLSLEKASKHPRATEWLFEYVSVVNKGCLAAEVKAIIAANASWSVKYARHVIKSRFPEGEKAIAADAWCSARYARHIIRGRFPEGEKAIASDPLETLYYARYVIKGRFKEGEGAIAIDPELKEALERVDNAYYKEFGESIYENVDNGGGPWVTTETLVVTGEVNDK